MPIYDCTHDKNIEKVITALPHNLRSSSCYYSKRTLKSRTRQQVGYKSGSITILNIVRKRDNSLEVVKLEFFVGHGTDVDRVFQFLQVFADVATI